MLQQTRGCNALGSVNLPTMRQLHTMPCSVMCLRIYVNNHIYRILCGINTYIIHSHLLGEFCTPKFISLRDPCCLSFKLPRAHSSISSLQWVRVSSRRLTSKLFYQRATIRDPVSTIKVLFNPGLLRQNSYQRARALLDCLNCFKFKFKNPLVDRPSLLDPFLGYQTLLLWNGKKNQNLFSNHMGASPSPQHPHSLWPVCCFCLGQALS